MSNDQEVGGVLIGILVGLVVLYLTERIWSRRKPRRPFFSDRRKAEYRECPSCGKLRWLNVTRTLDGEAWLCVSCAARHGGKL